MKNTKNTQETLLTRIKERIEKEGRGTEQVRRELFGLDLDQETLAAANAYLDELKAEREKKRKEGSLLWKIGAGAVVFGAVALMSGLGEAGPTQSRYGSDIPIVFIFLVFLIVYGVYWLFKGAIAAVVNDESRGAVTNELAADNKRSNRIPEPDEEVPYEFENMKNRPPLL